MSIDGAGETMSAPGQVADAAPREASPDPWQALAQVGTQLMAALASANDPQRAGASLDRARSVNRRAKPEAAAAATGRRAATRPRAVCAGGRLAEQDRMTERRG